MLPNNPVSTIDTYAPEASYKERPGETSGSYEGGVIPLDTLPAAWWNWLWNQITTQEGQTVIALNNLFAEITNVLSDAGISPSTTDTAQLKQAIYALSQRIATASVAGAVKSSSANGQVTVEADGTMTANGLGNVANLTTTAKLTVVAAINEIHDLTQVNAQDIVNIVNKIGDLATVPGNPATVAVGLQTLHSSISSLSSSVTGSFASVGSSLASISSSVANNSANWNAVYNSVVNNSSIWGAAGSQGAWTNSSDAWNANSGWKNSSDAWNANSGWKNSSANWNNARNSVANNSANWNQYTAGTAAYYYVTNKQLLTGVMYTSAGDKLTLTTVSAPYMEGHRAITIEGKDYYVEWAVNSIPCVLVSLTPNSPAGYNYSSVAVARLCQSAASGASAHGSVTASSANWNKGYSSASSAYSSVTANSANWNKYTAGTAAYDKVTASSANWNKYTAGTAAYDKVTASSANWNKASTNGSWTGSSAGWNNSCGSGYSGYTKITGSCISIPVGVAYSTRANIWIQ